MQVQRQVAAAAEASWSAAGDEARLASASTTPSLHTHSVVHRVGVVHLCWVLPCPSLQEACTCLDWTAALAMLLS